MSKWQATFYHKRNKVLYQVEENRVITKIEEYDKKRCKIYIDEEFSFLLYKGELKEYEIKQGMSITEDIYDTIVTELLPKRAKKRCLNLLQKKNYTEYKLREKLKEGWYPVEIEEEAIAYVKSFHYIDDYRYACDYIFYHKNLESKKKIEDKLKLKGIQQDILQQAFMDSYEEGEEQQIELEQAYKLLQKKHFDSENMDWKEIQKIYAYLIRKGISSSVIKKAMAFHHSI